MQVSLSQAIPEVRKWIGSPANALRATMVIAAAVAGAFVAPHAHPVTVALLVLMTCGVVGTAILVASARRRRTQELLLSSVYEPKCSLFRAVEKVSLLRIPAQLEHAAAAAVEPSSDIDVLRAEAAISVAAGDIHRVQGNRCPVWTRMQPFAGYLSEMVAVLQCADSLAETRLLVDLIWRGSGQRAVAELEALHARSQTQPLFAAWLANTLLPAARTGEVAYRRKQDEAAAREKGRRDEAERASRLRQEELRLHEERLKVAKKAHEQSLLIESQSQALARCAVLLRKLDRPIAGVGAIISDIEARDDSARSWSGPLDQLRDWAEHLQNGHRSLAALYGLLPTIRSTHEIERLTGGATELFEQTRIDHAVRSAQIVGVLLAHKKYTLRGVGAQVRRTVLAVLKYLFDSAQSGSEWRSLWRTVDRSGSIWLHADDSAGDAGARWRSFHCKLTFLPSGRADIDMQLELFVPCGIGDDPTVYPQEITEGELRPGQRVVVLQKPFASWKVTDAHTETTLNEHIKRSAIKIAEHTNKARTDKTTESFRRMCEEIEESIRGLEEVNTKSRWSPSSQHSGTWRDQIDTIRRHVETSTARRSNMTSTENARIFESSVSDIQEIWEEACREHRSSVKQEVEDRLETGCELELKGRGIDFRDPEAVLRAWSARCGRLRYLIEHLQTLTDWMPGVERDVQDQASREEADVTPGRFWNEVRRYAVVEHDHKADGWFRVSASERIHGTSAYEAITVTEEIAAKMKIPSARPDNGRPNISELGERRI